MGEMNAKDDAKKTGTMRPVQSWKIRVPIPAVKRATLGSSPVISGINTSAPKATNSICEPARARWPNEEVWLIFLLFLLLGSKNAVAGIPQSGQDVAFFVQSFINGGRIEVDIRMGFFQIGNAFWSSHQNQGTDFLTACFFQKVDGGNHGAAGGQHRVDDERSPLVHLAHQFVEVGARSEERRVGKECRCRWSPCS